MQSKVKLSKREIKEDKFATFMLTSKQRLSDNWQYVAIGGVVVVLAIVGIVYLISSGASSRVEGGERFAQAMGEYRGGNLQVAATTFQQVVDDFGSHPSAARAAFMLGQVNFEMRNHAEAIRYWTLYLDKYQGDKIDRSGALAGLAGAYEEQGDFAQASAKYLEAVEELPDGPMASYYRAGAVRSFLGSNQFDKAREQLDQLKQKDAESDVYLRAARYYAEKTAAGQP